MKWTVTTAPATEPITYAQVKTQCALTLDDDQAFLTGLIPVVRAHCEKRTARSLITQTLCIYSVTPHH